VPGPQRKALVDRFREEPACRAFLSTDAGGVGLNLQHAAVVVNMDLPWNPAVLEQRIGRVHRLGQKQPVRVVNFVSQGTIEEGMLSVLSFKKSLFAGTLDGGQKDVFLGGTRLKQFMDTVEKVTAAIPEPTDTEPAPLAEAGASEDDSDDDEAFAGTDLRAGSTNGRRRREAQGETGRERPASTSLAGAPAGSALDPLAGLLQTGLKYLEQLAAATQAGGPAGPSGPPSPSAVTLVERDARTGETYLKLPMPPREVVDGFLQAVGKLLERYRS
jgi:superfamily II DNA/RNA helicase